MTIDVEYLDAVSLRHILADGNEIALLDVRELTAFSIGHLWLANNLPLSRLELQIRRFVPRNDTRIVICDDANGIAERAANVLGKMEFSNLHILQGGVPAWSEAGFDLTDGNYVIAHAFGFFIEEQYGLQIITASDLRNKIQNREDILIIDARAEHDYTASSLPGSISVPAAEVARRLPDLINSSHTQVIVHCAGITRAALGAQEAISCGLSNPVYSLHEGTKAWVLAGGDLSSNQTIAQPNISANAKAFALQAATKLKQRNKLKYVTHEKLRKWSSEHSDRTCYLIDVRSEQEYFDSHYSGTISIPGGELAGMTIDHLATHNARLYLFAESDCARAEFAASWMLQSGWPEVFIVSDWKTATCINGAEPDCYPELDQTTPALISVNDLVAQLARDGVKGNTRILDFSQSDNFRKHHIPGAIWASRIHLYERLGISLQSKSIVVSCENGEIARLAAKDLKQELKLSATVLKGGNLAWRSAGMETVSGIENTLGKVNDIDPGFFITPEMEAAEVHKVYQRLIDWRINMYAKFKQQRPHEFIAIN
ncbi:MAG: rhodanese-like domain-containing protein [Arenicellales bacterium WSBS_2016_MAG_OTU3]